METVVTMNLEICIWVWLPIMEMLQCCMGIKVATFKKWDVFDWELASAS